MSNIRCFDSNNAKLSASDRSSEKRQKTIYNEIKRNVQLLHTGNPVKNNGAKYNSNTIINSTCLKYAESYELLDDVCKGSVLCNNSNAVTFLKTQILPLTGLTSTQINTLTSMLNQNTVIYGSSILYAYKNTLNLGGSSIGDIDIATNSLAEFNSIHAFLTASLTNVTLYDQSNNGIITVVDPSLNIGFSVNPQLQYYIQNTTAPPDVNTMGVFNVAAVDDPSVIGINNATYANAGTGVAHNNIQQVSTFYFNENLMIQLVLYSTTNIMQNEIMQYGDFTAASGVYNGTCLFVSDDIDENKTIYRGDVDTRKQPLPSKLKDWLLYRLDKYIKRGFTIYFANQGLIDLWNNQDWFIAAGVTANFTCPFSLTPNDVVQTTFKEISTPIDKNQTTLNSNLCRNLCSNTFDQNFHDTGGESGEGQSVVINGVAIIDEKLTVFDASANALLQALETNANKDSFTSTLTAGFYAAGSAGQSFDMGVGVDRYRNATFLGSCDTTVYTNPLFVFQYNSNAASWFSDGIEPDFFPINATTLQFCFQRSNVPTRFIRPYFVTDCSLNEFQLVLTKN